MVWHRARVYHLILVYLPTVNRSVLFILTVRVIEHASQKNAEIHAKVLVDCTQNVSLTTTCRYAYVQKDLLEIRLGSAFSDLSTVCTRDQLIDSISI